MLLAVPSITLHGGIHIVGVEVFHFSFGDFFKFGSSYLPALLAGVLPEPFSTPAAFLNKSEAGGVFILKVNVRSS